MLAASPPEGCNTNNNGALGFKVLGTYSMKVRSRPPTVLAWRVASPIGSAATVVAPSANAAPIVQCGSLVSAMISRLRFTPAYHIIAKRMCAPFECATSMCYALTSLPIDLHAPWSTVIITCFPPIDRHRGELCDLDGIGAEVVSRLMSAVASPMSPISVRQELIGRSRNLARLDQRRRRAVCSGGRCL